MTIGRGVRRRAGSGAHRLRCSAVSALASAAHCLVTPRRRGLYSDRRSMAGSAGVIQLVECQLPKLDVAGSSPVARSLLTTSYDAVGAFLLRRRRLWCPPRSSRHSWRLPLIERRPTSIEMREKVRCLLPRPRGAARQQAAVIRDLCCVPVVTDENSTQWLPTPHRRRTPSRWRSAEVANAALRRSVPTPEGARARTSQLLP